MGMGRDLPPDLPFLFEGSPKVGLGLYNSVAAALVTDIGLLIAGIVVYLVGTRAKDRTGTLAFWLTVLFIVMLALPAAVPGLSILAMLALVLLLPLGNWVDRHRSLAAASVPRVS
jgi:ABC-type Fe3+ transport system permease subunit